MSVIIINPNSTVGMTEAMLDVAKSAAPGLNFEGWTSLEGPPAIQGEEDGALATPPLLDLVRKSAAKGAEGVVIGCFDDTGLVEAAALAERPVVGIGQASFHYAALRNWRFSVVTTLPVSVPVIEGNIRRLGLEGFLENVRASHVPVLDLENRPEAARQTVIDEVKRAAIEDGVDAIILGCAGMANLAEDAQRQTGITIIDPVSTAARSMNWLL